MCSYSGTITLETTISAATHRNHPPVYGIKDILGNICERMLWEPQLMTVNSDTVELSKFFQAAIPPWISVFNLNLNFKVLYFRPWEAMGILRRAAWGLQWVFFLVLFGCNSKMFFCKWLRRPTSPSPLSRLLHDFLMWKTTLYFPLFWEVTFFMF